MFEDIFLEREQEQLLKKLVEAHRNVSSENRQYFYVTSQQGSGNIACIQHNGFPSRSVSANLYDIDTLDKINFIELSQGSRHTFNFRITPYGFKYYEDIKEKEGSSVRNVESEAREYIDDFDFKDRYEITYKKWIEADELLWQSDSNEKLTQIGHLCRESVQEFTEVLTHDLNLDETYPAKTKTIARLKLIIEHLSNKLGETGRQFLDSLLSYWRSINDLIQKQEHGAQKEGKQLIWEDGRRVVFQTLIVMYEIDRIISHFK